VTGVPVNAASRAANAGPLMIHGCPSRPLAVPAEIQPATSTSARRHTTPSCHRNDAGSIARAADTGVGRAVLATVLAAVQSEALAAVTEILANYSSADGVHLDASIWITTANASRL